MQKSFLSFLGRILPYLLLFFAPLLIPEPLKAQDSRLRLASFNAMFLYDEVGDEKKSPQGRIPRKESDFEKIKSHLLKIDPDVIALQEVENEEAIRKILPASFSCSLTKKISGYDQRVGICWKNKFRFADAAHYSALAIEPGLRSGVEATLSIGNRNYSFLSVHLKAGNSKRDKNLRSKQLLVLNEILKTKENFFLLGDMNSPLGKDHRSWKLLSEGLNLKNPGRYVKQSCWGHKDLIDLIVTDVSIGNSKLVPVPFAEDDGAFDGVPANESGLSDHCPVVLDVRLEG
ncbi:endonuclease/exonuclease/phosphatase family protein [Leptospira sp. FAT2]|uniref:endonuclease/exonuclease/phosphatase family protein n=1 Tax=Leptospira sanjuanensis TaxID=2879643 RepID=UPI001EE79317|nr:endonuclease/exonuclease/phosphatase family protein [Leptospira sanjuanensis]MCG6192650.1 endonuclease/exonuclease/phosphatase family protein [Leptospira sanjuanensis]